MNCYWALLENKIKPQNLLYFTSFFLLPSYYYHYYYYFILMMAVCFFKVHTYVGREKRSECHKNGRKEWKCYWWYYKNVFKNASHWFFLFFVLVSEIFIAHTKNCYFCLPLLSWFFWGQGCSWKLFKGLRFWSSEEFLVFFFLNSILRVKRILTSGYQTLLLNTLLSHMKGSSCVYSKSLRGFKIKFEEHLSRLFPSSLLPSSLFKRYLPFLPYNKCVNITTFRAIKNYSTNWIFFPSLIRHIMC